MRGEYGHDLIDELQPLTGEPVVDKPGYSAFASTDLDLLLRNRGITALVLSGVTTEVCVSSTLRDAVERGYACTLVGDACASPYPELHAAALAMVEVEGGVFGRVCDSRQAARRMECLGMTQVTKLWPLLTATHRYDKSISTWQRNQGVMIEAPILAYLIETRHGRILYDVGCDYRKIADPALRERWYDATSPWARRR